ncbi:MAG: hypothetical protein HOV87_21565 [Catenulispora sp.]|nr:hypothetical protein [Catenulispora sp.]
MLVTNHVLSGAVVGAVAKRPLPALLAGVASHFVLDSLPHWGKWDSDEQFLRVAVADGLTGLVAMGVVTRAVLKGGDGGRLDKSGRRKLAVAVLAGMSGAALPDLDKPASMLLGHQLWPGVVNRFHGRIQDEAPNRFVSHELVAAAGFALTAAAMIRRRTAR